jgi:hypothetical protein
MTPTRACRAVPRYSPRWRRTASSSPRLVGRSKRGARTELRFRVEEKRGREDGTVAAVARSSKSPPPPPSPRTSSRSSPPVLGREMRQSAARAGEGTAGEGVAPFRSDEPALSSSSTVRASHSINVVVGPLLTENLSAHLGHTALSSSAMSSTRHAAGAGGTGSHVRQGRGARAAGARRDGRESWGWPDRGAGRWRRGRGWAAGNGSSVGSSSIRSMPISPWRTQNGECGRGK